MKEFPTQDDLWFAFCTIINDTKFVRLRNFNNYFNKLIIPNPFKTQIKKHICICSTTINQHTPPQNNGK